MNKPRGHLQGEGVKPYENFITSALFSKSDHEGGGEVKIPKNLTT